MYALPPVALYSVAGAMGLHKPGNADKGGKRGESYSTLSTMA